MITREFLLELKRVTEAKWLNRKLSGVYGFQFQAGTRWNPGLTEEEIAECETALSARFPDDYREFLRAMNGTDLPTINTFGNSGVKIISRRAGVYSFPRDIEQVITLAEQVDRDAIEVALADGFKLSPSDKFIPIYEHRFLMCASDPTISLVLSVQQDDAIIYGDNLENYLNVEFIFRYA
jgi:hypothetical protein